jgi:hypothetical protein
MRGRAPAKDRLYRFLQKEKKMSIFKSKKRILSIVLAVVMIAALFLCGSAMAAGNNDRSASATVTVVVQSKNSAGVTTPVGTVSNYTVTTSGSSVTVYDVVEAIAADGDVFLLKDAVWKEVPSGLSTAKALVALSNRVTSNGMTTVNVWGTNIIMVYDSTGGAYEGTDWIYYVNNIYIENYYMDQYSVTTGDVITLSYEYSEFEW